MFIVRALVCSLVVAADLGLAMPSKNGKIAASAKNSAKAMEFYQARKYTRSAPVLKRLQTYRWSRYADLAHLYAGEYLSRPERPYKAINAAQRFLSRPSPDTLYRQIGFVALA